MSARVTDTSPYVGHGCSICGKIIKLSHNNGWYRWSPDEKRVVEAAHIGCKFPKGRPRPDYDPHIDYPERFTDGPI